MKQRTGDNYPVFSYFPGCSLATSARENNESMIQFLKVFGIQLEELDDWNCCGSSSAHSVDTDLAFALACRNLSLAPSDRPLLVACPGCYLRLRGTQLHIGQNDGAKEKFQRTWERPFDPDLKIIHFFELLRDITLTQAFRERVRPLEGLRIAPYYGCMLAHPPAMRHTHNFSGIMEGVIESIGAASIPWGFSARCCGTFLTVARPDIAETMVEQITHSALQSGADCILTACAMCHLNLEVRAPRQEKLPIFHFSEMLALAMGLPFSDHWLSRHLIDPKPLLEQRDLI